MTTTREGLAKLATFEHAVVAWIDDDGYPTQTPVLFSVDEESQRVHIEPTGVPLPGDREVSITGSHIRPQPGIGYDERRYISLWGVLVREGDAMVLSPRRAWGWDEAETPFFEYSERSNAQARRYLASLSRERGREVKPRLSPLWTFLVATRLPFLTATLIPVLLGIAVAGRDGHFSLWLAALTLLGAMAVHVGLNVANDVFDALNGADEANVNPTQFSGGSRVIQRGLLSTLQMASISAAAYTVGAAAGLALVIIRGSVELFVIGVIGVLLSVFYTAPPFRLVHRGLGELTTAIGFGPLMVLGAYVVQTGSLSWEAFVASIPVAILIALVLYVNEIPDRASDARAGKYTLPVRLGRDAVITVFLVAALTAFGVVATAAVAGILPLAALLALAALPLVFQVHRGIKTYYDSPYELMPWMGRNIQVHLSVGLLMFAGYMLAIVASAVSAPDLLT